MTDFSNFNAVYNELCDAVMGARYQFFRDHLANFFDTIDQTPAAKKIVGNLESQVDLKSWYAECKKSIGSMVGSGRLDWPKDRTDKLAMRVALLRAFSTGQIEPIDFTHDFLYSENNFNTNISDIGQQIFQPTARELIRHIEQHFDNPPDIPAADRVVAVDHNSKGYLDADEAMEALEKAIREANDFDDPLEREQREAEVSAARRLLRATRVRVDALVALLKPLVIQYATKLKDSLVGIAVAGTITALGYLFGKIFG